MMKYFRSPICEGGKLHDIYRRLKYRSSFYPMKFCNEFKTLNFFEHITDFGLFLNILQWALPLILHYRHVKSPFLRLFQPPTLLRLHHCRALDCLLSTTLDRLILSYTLDLILLLQWKPWRHLNRQREMAGSAIQVIFVWTISRNLGRIASRSHELLSEER